MKAVTYVGVHVRRTDYIGFLKRMYNASPANPDYFVRQMNVFRNKYQRVLFVVVSDDPKWCESEFHGDDIVIMKTNFPARDFAIMAVCNHSIIYYDTYGMWGAILSGGDTFVYNLSKTDSFNLAWLVPNWYIGT
jgi:galactoside 2-L-fucosyltransferase 1/2